MNTKQSRILNLADLFVSTYMGEQGLLLNRGKVRTFVGRTKVDYDFFVDGNTDGLLDQNDFELFKTYVYGVGKNYFRLNDDLYSEFDHSGVRNVSDLFKQCNSESVSVSFIRDNEHFVFHILSIERYLSFILRAEILKLKNSILDSFNNMDDTIKTRQIIKDHFLQILYSSQIDFDIGWENIFGAVLSEAVNKFKESHEVFIEKGANSASYIFSDYAGENVSIDNFIEDVSLFENCSSNITDLLTLHKGDIKNFVENEFANLLRNKRINFDIDNSKYTGKFYYE